ncbi:hypothetical protein [Paenibacillus sp. FSL H3-0333]|uniref:hypothetical protein n=1 Tax=Paenibacillus sp. FSL H3-0333 TaxID=2921373 RepID=UPI0030F6E528
MINVSKAYRDAVYAPMRKTAATVQFDILDNTAYEDNIITASNGAIISRPWQLDNKIRNTSNRYATFEKDYFKLDGTFCIPPKSTEADESELGWWSEALSDNSGNFTSPQIINCEFEEAHSSLGISIVFDKLTNEFASDFDIDIYYSDERAIKHVEVIGNTSAMYVYEVGLDEYKRIKITIKKWSKPFRRARVIEIDFGVVKSYDSDKLIKVNVVEEMNVVGDTVPSNEMKFTIDNSSKEFNILNPKGVYKYLTKNQEVNMSLGVEIAPDVFEYIGIHKFYLTDWQSDEGSLTTTFTARDILNNLETITYIGVNETNLYDLAEDIMIQSGIKNYVIDNALKDIPTKGFKEKISARVALQHIGLASQSAVYQDRKGILNIQRFTVLDARTNYLTHIGDDGLYTSPTTFMEIDNDYSMKSITFDNVYNEPQIKLDKLVSGLEIVVNTYSADENNKEVLNTSLEVEGTMLIQFDYQYPIISSTANLSIVGAEDFRVISSHDIGIKLEIIASGTVNISVNGTSISTLKTVYTLNDNSVTEGIELKVDNPLIVDPAQALEIGKWILQESTLRALYDVNWRQNPCLECGDIVLVEDSYGAKKLSRIIKQEYTFAGYLNGKTSTKGGI